MAQTTRPPQRVALCVRRPLLRDALVAGLRGRGLTAVPVLLDELLLSPRGAFPSAVLLDAELVPEIDPVALQRMAETGIVVCIGEPRADLEEAVVSVRFSHDFDALALALRGQTPRATGIQRAGGEEAGHALACLTDREFEVLAELLSGDPSAEIAERLGISTHTVRTHVQNVLAKLDAGSRLEAAAIALKAGLRAPGTEAVAS